MSNTKKFRFKSIFCSLIICIGILLSAFANFNFHNVEKDVFAGTYSSIKKDVSEDLLGNYHSFYTTSTSKPASVSGWSEISESVVNTDNMIKGIVDLENETTFNTTTYKTTKPNMPKDKDDDKAYFKNLMINSYNGSGRLGYKSNSISLEANSYYSIHVSLYTHRTAKTDTTEETDPTASIYLTGLTDEEELENQVKFENINTLTSWEEYTFYIDTDVSKSINLELWLGSKTTNVQGAVFFNQVKIYRYSEDFYKEDIVTEEKIAADTAENEFNIISLSKPYTQPVKNSNFETITPMDWTTIAKSTTVSQRCEIVDVNNFTLTTDDKTIKAPISNSSASNELALFMYNKNDGYQGIESSTIKIGQLGYYKISFWAKSDCNTGNGATVYLVDKSENNPIDNAKLVLSTSYTSGSNSYRNDWTQYSFYIYGDDVEEKEITIQIWMGTKDSQTSGYVFIDDFRMENIDYETYSNNSSSSNSTAMNFNNDTDSFVVTNSNFNRTKNSDNQNQFPLTPADWTVTGNNNNTTFSGVINTDESHFNSNIANYSSGSLIPSRPKALPYTTNENNNVLMIGSSSENNTQTYSSNSLSLSANSYYKLSFYVATDYRKPDLEDNLGARVRITSSTKTIFDYYNIFYTDNDWHKFEIYFKTGVNSETAILELKLEKLTGFVFFDEIMLETSNETTYNSHYEAAGNHCFHVDLTYENFDNRTYNKFVDIQTPNNWTSKEQDNLTVNESGIISTEDNRISELANPISGNKNVLYISSLHDVNYSYSSKESYTFTAQQYYKITVNVLTSNLIVESDLNNNTFGASIGLTNSKEIILKNIRTNGDWKTCTLYVCLEEDLTTPITLSLGATNEKVSGQVLFDNLKIESIDKATFEEDIKTTDNSLTASYINYTEPTEEEEDSSTWTNDFNWLIIPSLLTGLAIVIAVVGFYARKITFNKKPKIKTKYDRRKTLDKDIDRREKIALRQQIIDELNAELLSIDKEIAEYEKLAEEQLEETRQKILAEKEEIKRQQIELEIRKKEATAEREKQLKAIPELVSNKKAETDFERFIAKLDKQAMNLQKQITLKEVKLENTKEADKLKIAKYLERKEFIKNEIAKIEAEIEEIAKEEAQMWEEYKLAKQQAKQRKLEYKAQLKAEKEAKKSTTKNCTTTKSTNNEKSVESEKSTNTKKADTTKKVTTTKNPDTTKKVSNNTKQTKKSTSAKSNKSSK